MAEPERARAEADLDRDPADVLRLSDTEKAIAEQIVEEELRSEGRPAGTDKDFFHALGGWGALLDIGLPWIAFLVVYWVTDDNLSLAAVRRDLRTGDPDRHGLAEGPGHAARVQPGDAGLRRAVRRTAAGAGPT